MSTNSTFLNGELEEEVHIEHSEGFPLTENKDIVSRLKKKLCGLKKAPKTWYARLDKYLTKLGYRKGMEKEICIGKKLMMV